MKKVIIILMVMLSILITGCNNKGSNKSNELQNEVKSRIEKLKPLSKELETFLPNYIGIDELDGLKELLIGNNDTYHLSDINDVKKAYYEIEGSIEVNFTQLKEIIEKHNFVFCMTEENLPRGLFIVMFR